MTSTFQVGDIVKRKAFTDAFGKDWPETPALVVATVRRIEPSQPESRFAIQPYYRVLAYGPGLSSYEGAERFFVKDSGETER